MMRKLTEIEVTSLIAEFYSNYKDYSIGFWAVVKDIRDIVGEGELVRDESLLIVSKLLKMGFRAEDSPYHSAVPEPWPNQELDTVLNRIRAEWDERGHEPNIPDAPWFSPAPR